MNVSPQAEPSSAPAAFRLFLGLLGPPLVWLASLQAIYGVASFACDLGISRLPMHAITIAAAIAIAAATASSWQSLRRSGIRRPVDAEAHGHRSRFLAVGGLVLAAQFLVVIVAQGLAVVFLAPCQ
jgi:hypothetical protein